MFSIRAGNVGAPATVGREKERQKNLDEGDAPGSAGTLSGSLSE
jgi:hypothetical protein